MHNQTKTKKNKKRQNFCLKLVLVQTFSNAVMQQLNNIYIV